MYIENILFRLIIQFEKSRVIYTDSKGKGIILQHLRLYLMVYPI